MLDAPDWCRPAQVRSWLMAKQKGPTAEDRATAIGVALSGIAGGLELGEIAARLAPLHPKNNTFPGEVLLELAADAIEESGASREQPLEFEGIRKRHLPEDRAHTRAQHHKAEYALRAAAMVRAGVDPGLLDEVSLTRSPDSGPPVVGVRRPACWAGGQDHDEASPSHPGADRAEAA